MTGEPRRLRDAERLDALPSLVRLVADRASAPQTHRARICLFLGAGADLSSGGLSFGDLKRQALEEFVPDSLFDVTTPEQLDARFDERFALLPADDRALLIESLFRRLQPLAPSDAYKLVVLLAEAGGLDAVVTTNFDVMLERAQSQLGRDVFQVFAPGLARPYLIAHPRYDLPKKPYVKLHGDLASRSVVLLTAEELEHPGYDRSMLELLTSILETHDLVLAGYSGSDPELARIIADAIARTTNRVFWCSPFPPGADSPLYRGVGERVLVVRTTFDRLMMEIARPVLERPSLATTEPTYLSCLFDWRVDYCNREYLHTYAERSGRSLVDTFARRPAIEDRLASFLLPNRPLAIISGPSGFGKTTVGIRLHRLWRGNSSTRILLIRSRALADSGDLEQYVASQLGGLGSRDPLTLFRLESWLRENGLRLVLFVDGINEFSPDLSRTVQFFRGILRFCYFLPETDSALRVIATIRQETWSAMLAHVDLTLLRRVLWGDGDPDDSSRTIACDALTDDELQDAVARLREHGQGAIDTDELAPSVVDRLRDPYLLRLVAEAAADGLPPLPGAAIYQRAFEAKLSRRNSSLSPATLKDSLATLALRCVATDDDRFREIDIVPASLRADLLRVAKDLGIIVDARDGLLQFDHDRTFEYFLALAFASGTGPPLETLDDLRRFLVRFKTQSKPVAAARLYFQLAPRERFRLISAALRALDQEPQHTGDTGAARLFDFGREVLMEMVEHGEPYAEQYLADAIDAARAGRINEPHFRAVVQAAANLPTGRAVRLLARAAQVTSSLAGTEAAIYATDKLVKSYLIANCPPVDLLRDPPYATFFGDATIARWQQLGRLLGLVSRLGPDNTNSAEYTAIVATLEAGFQSLRRQGPWLDADAAAVTHHVLEHCDRLLFNATLQGIAGFFTNPARPQLTQLLDRLAGGSVLVDGDLALFEPYTQSLAADIEYQLGHIFFVISSFNDLEATLQLAEARVATFSNDTAPETIDFFQTILVYLHVLHGLAYDERRFASWEERILRDWPDVLLYRPGMDRGERRGFQDPFDRFFEDGFGVLFAYGDLRPSRLRAQSRFAEYRSTLARHPDSQLPLYTKYLEQFLREGRIEEALQVLHALAGVIVAWPMEGLGCLRGMVGHPHPRIRRATVRILAEAYGRHPEETIRFLKTSGVAVSDEEWLDIKVRQDARIGRRQIEEDEWARIGHFLLRGASGRVLFARCIRTVLTADSLEAAVRGVLYLLGFLESTGR